jgi:flagellar basal-body rod modification protein FlgD
MPEIGNPNAARNRFQNVKMSTNAASKLAAQNTNNSNAPKDIGKQLNRIAGIREESQFVKEKDHNKMDKNAFLKLLSNQLANQDPFKPVDQKKFASDLAQFSQLEQLTNMNSKFDKAFNKAPDQHKFLGASLLGKTVLTEGTSIKVDEESSVENLPFYLDKPAKKLMVRIFDSSNNMIQQIDIDGMGKGNQSVMWDLNSLDGTKAMEGEYRFQVTGWDETFNQFKGQTRAEGRVTGVEFEGDEVLLTVDGGKKMYLRDVHSFSDKPRAAAKNSPLKQMASQKYNEISEQAR